MSEGIDSILLGFFAMLFFTSGINKIIRVHAFVEYLNSTALLPNRTAPVVAVAIALVELSLVLLLMLFGNGQTNFLIVAGVLAIFTAFVGWALKSNRATTCFCFGSEERLSSLTLVRNLILIALALVAAACTSRASTVQVFGRYRLLLVVHSVTAFAIFWIAMRLATIELALKE